MKLYILRPLEENFANWEPWYDKCFGFVIRAETTDRAREIADENAGDENRGEFMYQKTSNEKHPWLNPEYSSCIELTRDGPEELVIQDFHAA